MERSALLAGAVSAMLAIALGAFGAHSLRDRLGPQMLAVFETGVRYQFFHALALLVVGLLAGRWPAASLLSATAILFVIGTGLFSGSLYLLALTGHRALGAITPLGGLCFLAGWACLIVMLLRRG